MLCHGFHSSFPCELDILVVSHIRKKRDLAAVRVLNRYFYKLVENCFNSIKIYQTLKERVHKLESFPQNQNIFWRWGIKLHSLDPRLIYRSQALVHTLKFMALDHPERGNITRKIELCLINGDHRIAAQKTVRIRRLLHLTAATTALIGFWCLIYLGIILSIVVPLVALQRVGSIH